MADGEEYLNESNKNLFYTVCTRALHELKIFTNKDLAEMLPKIRLYMKLKSDNRKLKISICLF